MILTCAVVGAILVAAGTRALVTWASERHEPAPEMSPEFAAYLAYITEYFSSRIEAGKMIR